MPRAQPRRVLETWEVALAKALLRKGGFTDQDVLAYFTRPTRSVNHRVVAEIRKGERHKAVEAATDEELEAFLAAWPEVDPVTGLSLRGDELLIKAREAMIAAVHTFNGAGLHFRTELFVVTAIIAWTYLLHAFFRREGIDYRHHGSGGEVARTEHGADKYWDLGRCLRANRCPLDKAVKDNLEFLYKLRHEIEHRSTNRLDEAVSAKLQACAINFNEAVKGLFGPQYGLERRLPIALQFVTFSPDQRVLLKRAGEVPRHIETMMDAFHRRLSEDEMNDPRFGFRVAFVPRLASRARSADVAYEFVRPGSEGAEAIEKVLLKEVEAPKYKPGRIVQMMRDEGFKLFNVTRHTELWQSLKAKDPRKGYGAVVFGGDWAWYARWVDRVREHCKENAAQYRLQPRRAPAPPGSGQA